MNLQHRTPRPRASSLVWTLLIIAAAAGAWLLLGRQTTTSHTTSPSGIASGSSEPAATPEDRFLQALNRGKSAFEKGAAEEAVAEFKKAVDLFPTHPDARLNLANALLLANKTDEAIQASGEALKLQEQSAAAHYIRGCALLRKSRQEEALKSLQQAADLEPNIAAVSFQLGRAHFDLGHYEEAVKAFQEAVAAEPDHPAAHYSQSQAHVRLNQLDLANQCLELHKQIQAKRAGTPADTSTYERCKHTAIRLPFRLEQPQAKGVQVVFKDVTAAAFQGVAGTFKGPVGIMDINHRGANDLFVLSPEGFRLLFNSNGVFYPAPTALPGSPDGQYRRTLVADLQNDRYEDVIVLGEKASHVFKFATNGLATEVTAFTGLKGLTAKTGGLVDLDFSGKLDLITASPDGTRVQLFRNLGNLLFRDQSTNSGIPSTFKQISQIAVDDWNNDDLMDLFVAEAGKPPAWLAKQRGGKLVSTNSPASWPATTAFAIGDLNNDLHNDLVAVNGDQLVVDFSSGEKPAALPLAGFQPSSIQLIDYDNDGWLDIVAVGKGLKCWRNAGKAGFSETTQALGFANIGTAEIASITAADFDNDGAPDFLLSDAQGGLRLLRNSGAEANQQVKVRLFGNRSNASGLGIRLEMVAGGWRTVRTVNSLPIEIGVGQRSQLDSVTVRWFDLAVPEVEVKVEPKKLTLFMETILPTGSCPYVYAWNGERYEFITDILGAAPLGLPVAESRYIPADTDELAWIGNQDTMKPRDGFYSLQITEELREVLYLDEAKLWVVDHPTNTTVVSSSKLMPGPPFPKPGIIALEHRQPLVKAENLLGEDVTRNLQQIDKSYASPAQLKPPQLRGLAETHGVVLDFGPIDTSKPLALALNGWLRFGGGMANISASLEEDLPFPFPVLEAQTSTGAWVPVKVTVGAPAGKTKEILVDLTGKLPKNVKRLKLTAGFEIHWDRIALFSPSANDTPLITRLDPANSDLHWRGYSIFKDLPWTHPLTPDYEKVQGKPHWRITPEGWCTRYGPVGDLVKNKDNALALVNGGDELTLNFDASKLPPIKPGHVREFFLLSVGWDKDSDFHVSRGWTVGPLPYHGQNDQAYGEQSNPAVESAEWVRRYNTRYVGPLTLNRSPKSSRK